MTKQLYSPKTLKSARGYAAIVVDAGTNPDLCLRGQTAG
jgi:hypothetical protein